MDKMSPSCFQIVLGPLSLLLKPFAMMISLQMLVQKKGGYEAESGNEYCENYGQCGWKFYSGEVNPHWLYEELTLF